MPSAESNVGLEFMTPVLRPELKSRGGRLTEPPRCPQIGAFKRELEFC